MRTSMVIAAGALALAGCKKPAQAAPVTEAQAQQIAEATEADYATGDVNKMMSHYAKGAVVIDAGNASPTTDSATIKSWTGEFASMKPGDIAVSERTIKLLGPDAFVTSGIGHFTVQAGQARPAVAVRVTQVYQRQSDGSWKIVTEHMSAPPAPAAAG